MLAIYGGAPAVTHPPPHFRWPLIGPAEEAAVLAQLRSGVLSVQHRGDVVAELESAVARWLGVPHVMSTNSGTAALHAAFFALDLAPGDEVLAPAYTHLATALPMLHAQLVPVLCDVEAATGNLDIADAAARITPRTRAVVVTHQYGHVADMVALRRLADRHGLAIVEDCSHAHGATRDGALAGTFGDVACFSLQAHKAIPAGEGGFLATRHAHVFERAALLGHFRERTAATSEAALPFVETGYGLKLRMHPLAAALALVGLARLPDVIAARRENLAYFTARLADVPGVAPLPTAPGVDRGGCFRFLVHYDQPGVPLPRFLEALHAEGAVEARPGSLAKPLHLTAMFRTLDDRMYRTGWPRRGPHRRDAPVYAPGDFPRAEAFSAQTIQFPAFTEPCRPLLDEYAAALSKCSRELSA